jgi:phage major head subunit gpT-like protein
MTVDKLEDGKPNPYKGTAKVKVSARLTDDNAWFLLDTTKPVKPFVYQERKKPVFVQQTNMESPSYLWRCFNFGAEARGGGYGSGRLFSVRRVLWINWEHKPCMQR